MTTSWSPAPRSLCAGLMFAALLPSPTMAQDSDLDPAARANPNDRLDMTAWSIMASKGWSNHQTLGRTVRFIFDYAGEDVYGLDVAYTISPQTGFGGFFDRLLAARFQVAGKLSARAQESRDWIPEFEHGGPRDARPLVGLPAEYLRPVACTRRQQVTRPGDDHERQA